MLTFVNSKEEPGTKKNDTVKYQTSLSAACGKGGNTPTGTEICAVSLFSFHLSSSSHHDVP